MGRYGPTVGVPAALAGRRSDPATQDGKGSTVIIGTSSNVTTVNCTGSVTPHTKGAWTELVSSMPDRCSGLQLKIGATSVVATDSSTLLDIGIGAAASEIVVVGDVEVGFRGDHASFGATTLDLAVEIPVGSRVAVRNQSAIASKVVAVLLQGLMKRSDLAASPSNLVTIGTSTADSAGVSITAPTTNNVKGAWTEITASTSQPLAAIILCLGLPGGTTFAAANTSILVDVGIGSAGAEVVILSNHNDKVTTSEMLALRGHSGLVITHIPQGSRLSVRYQLGNATTPKLSASIIGVPYS